jgi:hypothetical protein
MARTIKEIWFGGSPDSEKEARYLHTLLDVALSNLSGLQQPPHSESEQEAQENFKQYTKAEKRVNDLAKDLYCALTGIDLDATK